MGRDGPVRQWRLALEALVSSAGILAMAARLALADLHGRGCVSGEQVQRLHDIVATGEDSYDFDMIDGYDELKYAKTFGCPSCVDALATRC